MSSFAKQFDAIIQQIVEARKSNIDDRVLMRNAIDISRKLVPEAIFEDAVHIAIIDVIVQSQMEPLDEQDC